MNAGAWTVILNFNRLIQLPLGVLVTPYRTHIAALCWERVAKHSNCRAKKRFAYGAKGSLVFIASHVCHLIGYTGGNHPGFV